MSGAEVKESIADISGLLTRIYNECCFKAQLNKFPETLPHNDSEDPFTNPFADFRDMVQPGRKGNPNYYFSGIPDMEVHKAGTPNNHAFYFLSQGASHWMDSADHSAFLPWGMEGIGFRKAAGLYYRAVVSYLPDDGDYYAVFSAMTGAAFLKYDGINSPEYKAVRHAYHGININDPIINAAIPDNYPAPQKILITSNQFLSTSSLPSQPNITIPHISLKPNKAPEKLWLSVTGPNSHTFAFNVPQNHKYVVRLHSIVGKNSFRVNENNNQLMDTVSAKKGAYKLFAGFGNPIVFSGKSLLQVTTWADDSTPSDNKYVLAIDVQQCKYLNADAVTNSFFCQ